MTFKEFAQKKTTISPLMAGREKLETAKLNGQDITITDFTMATDSNGSPYVVYITAEFPNNFCYGGAVLTDLFMSHIEMSGSEDNSRAELAQEGGLKVRLTSKRSKKGNTTYTAVEVI